MKFTLYTADCIGSLSNSIYPNKHIVTDETSMKAAAEFDHVTAEYKTITAAIRIFFLRTMFRWIATTTTRTTRTTG